VNTLRVVVADDQLLVRGAFSALIDSAPDLQVVGEAGTGSEAVELTRREHPDVALMDIRMPELDGLAATRQIAADPETAHVRVLILTTFDLDEYVYTALRAVQHRDRSCADAVRGDRQDPRQPAADEAARP